MYVHNSCILFVPHSTSRPTIAPLTPLSLSRSPHLQGELEFYDAACKALTAAGVTVPPYSPFSVFGFSLREPPHIVFHPNFAVSFANFKSKFPAPASVKIAQGATLVVKGNVTFHALDLTGTLVVNAAPGARVGESKLKFVREPCRGT